jgi:hypothetical protein
MGTMMPFADRKLWPSASPSLQRRPRWAQLSPVEDFSARRIGTNVFFNKSTDPLRLKSSNLR